MHTKHRSSCLYVIWESNYSTLYDMRTQFVYIYFSLGVPAHGIGEVERVKYTLHSETERGVFLSMGTMQF